MPIGVSLVLVILFLLMNAFFVMAEFSLVRVRRSQIEILVEEKRAGAKYASLVAGNVNAYLSACQLGITLASLALGWLGEPAVSALFNPLFAALHVPASAAYAISVAVGFCLITALHIVVGELIPKSMAIFSTERYALFTAAPLVWFYRLTFPIMWLFNTVTNAVIRLMGHDPADEHEVYTEEEIRLLIDESTESGLIDTERQEYVDNIFDIADKDAEAVMTPRPNMVCLSMEDSLEENLRLVNTHKFTRYPVYRQDKDDIIGFIHIKDLYNISLDTAMEDICIRRMIAAPESMSVVKLLGLFKREKTKMALVIDEHGGTSGLVTMGDIIGEIIGDYEDEYLHGINDSFRQISQNHYLATGSCDIEDFLELVDVKPSSPIEFETVGGLLFDLFDCIPSAGDSVEYAQDDKVVRFVIRTMENHRVGQIEFWVSQNAE